MQASRKARAVGAALLTLGTAAALAACSSGSNSSNTGAQQAQAQAAARQPRQPQARRHLHLLGPVPAVQRHLRLDEAGRVLRHAGRRDDQAHRLRHHRADHAGTAGRASRATPPDILLVDNPVVSTLAKAGRPHHHRAERPVHRRRSRRTSSARASSTAAPTACRSARTPWRSTTTRRSSAAAGVDPASITSWAIAHRRARQGEGHRQDGHHLLRHQHRGGQLPVPALVLGLRREPDQPRLRRRPSPRSRCGPPG